MEKLRNFRDRLINLIKAFPKSAALALVFLIFFSGYLAGNFQAASRLIKKNQESSQLRQKGSYKLVNPLLECDFYNEGNFLRSKELEDKLKQVAEKMTDHYNVKHVSIYFRDLNNGPWLGYNEEEKFTPASLLKVPIMMAYFKQAESDPEVLKKELVYKISADDARNFSNIEPAEKLENGKKYSIEKAIETMIRYSDNNAANLLLREIDRSFLEKVYSDLMLPVPGKMGETENFMTVKEYSSFFRILYNASYLSREMSERALRLLTFSDYRKGLVAGVPKDVLVAHKFGERRIDESTQLHDCGIVYNEQKPYLLCVMTRGGNLGLLEKVISEISAKVWEEVKKP